MCSTKGVLAQVTPSLAARALGDPITGPNRLKVTTKLIDEASKGPLHRGRLLINGSAAHVVQVCGILQSINQEEDRTWYLIYDGTGQLNGFTWPRPGDGRTELSGACLGRYYIIVGTITIKDSIVMLDTLCARLVDNYNHITEHFLSAIYERVDLLRRLQSKLESPETVEHFSIELCKQAVRDALIKDNSPNGLTAKKIFLKLNIAAPILRKALVAMIKSGEVYNTIDYLHYQLSDSRNPCTINDALLVYANAVTK